MLGLKIKKSSRIDSKPVEEVQTVNDTPETAKTSPRAGELRESALSESVSGEVAENSEYSAKSIRILTPEETENFEWVQVGKLATEFERPVEFIERGFECCRRIGIGTEYFISRYLRKDGAEKIPEFEAVYKEILNEQRMKLWTIS